MIRQHRALGLITFLLMALLGLVAAPVATQAASTSEADPDFISEPTPSDIRCQNTQFVQRKKNLSPLYPEAHLWNNGYLQSQGYHQVLLPANGDIAVFEVGVLKPIDPFGHVAIFKKITANSYWLLLGANQSSGPWISKAGCFNVSKDEFRPRSSSQISFWRK
jgi:hypothetical protein